MLDRRRALLSLAAALAGAGCDALDRPEYPSVAGAIKLGMVARRFPRASGYASRLAAQEINQAGGVLGRPLDLIVPTDRLCDPTHSRTVVGWVADQGVVGMVAALCSASLQADLTQVLGPSARDVPVVAVSASSPALSGLPNFYRTIPSDVWQGRLLAQEIVAQGLLTTSIIQVDDVYGSGISDAFAQRYAELGGRLLSRVKFPTSQSSDFTSQVEATFGAGKPSAVFIVALLNPGAAITRDIGLFPDHGGVKYFGSEALFGEDLLAIGDRAITEGMQGLTPAANPADPWGNRFVDAYRIAVGEALPESERPRLQGIYDSVYLFALAMQKGGAATAQAIRDNIALVSGSKGGTAVGGGEFAKAVDLLRAGTAIDYQGASGPIDLDANGDPSRGTYLRWRVSQGAFVIDGAVSFP